MCGVAQDTTGQSDVALPLEAAMPPSITLGSEPHKPAGGLGDRPPHQDHPPGKDIPTIDLSCDENDDLQKAIALSLQDQDGAATLQGMSAEEQEVSRALEASLKDSQPQATVDLLNPRERCRQQGRPVGLKNIGNSCWFNVVIQPLFHIPVFRDLILDFPQNLEVEEHMEESHKGPQLVPALRRLFALMIGSHRKYVDPSLAVQVFQGQEMRRNAQQDVCEFTHKLLERLEEEFQQLLRRQGVEKESSGRHISKDADFDNPIMKLFYGQAKKEACEATAEGEQQAPQQQQQQDAEQQQQQQEEGPKQEAFGQYPLRVTNFRHIHDSILASMSSSAPGGGGSSSGGGAAAPPRQETWFKMLPPVLVFSLSRYEYSHEKKRAEKVHNKFEFPEFLYMDRYMEANKDLVREKQVRVASLRGKLGALNRTLDRYLKYGSGAAQYPIADILRYTLDFAQAGGEPGQDAPSPPMMEVDGAEDDVEMAEDGLDWMPRPSPAPKEEEEEEDRAGEQQQLPPQQVPSPSKRMRLLPPAPRSISGTELATLQGCLMRWLKDVTAQVEELRRLIGELERQLSQVYEEPALRQVPYRLHAAVVHEGQASGGHYWVYIHDPQAGGWRKFNDIQVVEASWQEVLQDSVGGHNNTSAYCLLYIDQGRYPTLFPSAPKSQEELLAGLALDLQEHIKGDNQAFSRELEEWDARQEAAHPEVHETAASAEAASLPAPAPSSPDVVCLREGEESRFFTEVETMLTHMVREALTKAPDKAAAAGHVLYPLLNQQVTQLQNLDVVHSDTNSLYCEPSLLDFGVYLMRNLQNADFLLQVYGCEVVLQVARGLAHHSPLVEQAEREALHLLRQLTDKQRRAEEGQYRGWLRHYRCLVDCTWHLVYGFRQHQRGALEGALPHLLRACQIHRELQERPPAGARKTLNGRVLCQARNACLVALSKRVLDTFVKEEAEQLGDIPGVVNGLLVPALAQLLSSDTEEDRTTIEQVRARWCLLLDQEWEVVAPAKSKMVQQLLETIMNAGSEVRSSGPFQTPRPPNVLQLYKEYLKCCSEIMAEPPPAPPPPPPPRPRPATCEATPPPPRPAPPDSPPDCDSVEDSV
ncbi:ubiquitin carboxyl-terminal hydrolase 25-like [Scylla paramamosain]|uniref:ubiquitin carboxyl-terminal hydrolase 25-like n=1 Tax=Scylla paramamosain TaxID=85552 RepID=UPI0030833FBD